MSQQPPAPKPTPTPQQQTNSLQMRLLLTGMGAMCAETVTFPVDLTKTRLQLQGEGQGQGVKKRALQMAISIVKEEGVTKLFVGIQPALLRHVFYSPCRIVAYEQFRNYLSENGDGKGLSFWKRLASGATSGALGQLIASPADLIKVRMQADGRLVASGALSRPRYRGVVDALLTISREEGGVRALWKGWVPNVQRAALVNLGELSTYDYGKQSLLKSGYFNDNIWCHLCSSIISGFVSSVVSCPADVVKTRIMNMHSAKDGSAPLYRGSVDCFVKSVQKEGFLSLYKGFFPTWARLAPWQLTFWVSYEQLRRLAGVQSF